MAKGKENAINQIPENGAEVETKTSAPAISPVLNDDTRIVVKSLVPAVYYTCKTTFETFAWVEVGDEQEMTYKQLRIMKAKHPRYLTERWIVPCNLEVQKKLGLTDGKKKSKIGRADLSKFFGNDVAQALEVIVSLNEVGKHDLVPQIERYVKDGKIANVKMIRMLEKQLGLDLMQYV